MIEIEAMRQRVVQAIEAVLPDTAVFATRYVNTKKTEYIKIYMGDGQAQGYVSEGYQLDINMIIKIVQLNAPDSVLEAKAALIISALDQLGHYFSRFLYAQDQYESVEGLILNFTATV